MYKPVKEGVNPVKVKIDNNQYGNSGVPYLISNIANWHYDRNLIDGATDKDQFAKLIQECGELSENICKGLDVRDDIGDIIVVLINIAERNAVSISECLLVAWDDIKDRKGFMRDGVFIKEEVTLKLPVIIPPAQSPKPALAAPLPVIVGAKYYYPGQDEYIL